jgi:serine/threonine protein kinase
MHQQLTLTMSMFFIPFLLKELDLKCEKKRKSLETEFQEPKHEQSVQTNEDRVRTNVDRVQTNVEQPLLTANDVELESKDGRKKVLSGNPGSFADVYAASYCGNPVAVKVLRFRPCDTSLQAFKDEVSVCLSLVHPNIVRTFGGVFKDKADQPFWIVMERLEKTLAEVYFAIHALLSCQFCAKQL